MALGEAEVERWEEVLLNQEEVLVMVSTDHHRGLPPPAGQDMQGAVFTQWTPDKKDLNMLPNTTHFDPPTVMPLKTILGIFGQQEIPKYGQVLFVRGGGLEAHLGLAVEDLRNHVFTPPPPRSR